MPRNDVRQVFFMDFGDDQRLVPTAESPTAPTFTKLLHA
jgi:hypothetical protein